MACLLRYARSVPAKKVREQRNNLGAELVMKMGVLAALVPIEEMVKLRRYLVEADWDDQPTRQRQL